MIKIAVSLLSCFLLSLPAMADNDDMQVLDRELGNREVYIENKLTRIANITKELQSSNKPVEILEIYDRIANEYYVFKFDSAYSYVEKGLHLATRENNSYYCDNFMIKKAELLAFSGLYHESVDVISQIDTLRIDPTLAIDYYRTVFCIYNFWASYCEGTPFAELYLSKAKEGLKNAWQRMNADYEYYDYLNGEYYVYIEPDSRQALRYYNKVLERANPASRVYAQSCFSMANIHADDPASYRKYMVMAVVSDIQCCTMENLALQFLARHLYESDTDNLERAERYMSISLEDAKFYNNRLRIIEISRTFPAITSAYQKQLSQSYRRQKAGIAVLAALLVMMVVGLMVILNQKKKLSSSRRQLADSNRQLSLANEQQAELWRQASSLNERLLHTNRRRERLAKLYIDLTAKYIVKLEKFQTLVKRKIKANQQQELLAKMSSSRLTEEESAAFMNQFDKAFLDLYPSFVEELNSLLMPEWRIDPKRPHTLTTELRIFALIRLGVTESSEIAALLFYSPQTIYNYRSTVKSHAVDRDNFETLVAGLCTVVELT